MKLLFDTHAFIWWDSEPARLPSHVIDLCTDPDNVLLLSVASLWEMQIKFQLGKLQLRQPLGQLVADQEASNSIKILPISFEHVLGLEALAPIHRDPFDRLLVAQSQVEAAVLLTKDPQIRRYGIQIEWSKQG